MQEASRTKYESANPTKIGILIRRPWTDATRVTGFTALVALVLFLRRPDGLLRSQFWAEDGAVFFAGQISHGFWKSVGTPYSGYLHTIPRLIAAACEWFPVRWTPFSYNLIALLLSAFCCAAFYWPCFRRIIRSDASRAAACLAAAAAIPAGEEMIMTICNLQSYLIVLELLLIARNLEERSWGSGGLGETGRAYETGLAVLQVLICMTAPGALLYVPFLAYQVIRRRGWNRIVGILSLAALALQSFVVHQSQGIRPKLNFNVIVLAVTSSGLSRAVLAPVIGSSYLAFDSERALFVKLILALAGVTAIITALLFSARDWRQRAVVLSAVYVGTGSLILTLVGRGLSEPFLNVPGIRGIQGNRYFFLPSCVFIFLLVYAVDRCLSRIEPIRGLGLLKVAVLLAIFSLSMRDSFRVQPFVDLAWQSNAVKIVDWKAARDGGQDKPLVVPINPPPMGINLGPGN